MTLEFKVQSRRCQADLSPKQRHLISELRLHTIRFQTKPFTTCCQADFTHPYLGVCFTLPRAGGNFLPSCSWAAPKPRGSSIEVTSPSGCVVAPQTHQHQTPLQRSQGSSFTKDKACKDPLHPTAFPQCKSLPF